MIIVGGATATGKSAFAEEIARRIGGELISADSMQIYRGMDIGTAKDTASAIPLHMVDVVSPKTPFTVVDYKHAAIQCLSDLRKRGKEAVIVGGTGFYIDTFLYDLSYGGDGERDEKLYTALREELERFGAERMYERLKRVDPESALKIHANNTVRVLRAVYIYETTGKKASDQKIVFDPIEPFKMYILTRDRQKLRCRIADRVDKMLAMGLETEVGTLLQNGVTFDMQSMQGIGYKEWRGKFDGVETVEDIKNAIIKNTNAYAKRQETWFNNRYKNFAEKIDADNVNEDTYLQILRAPYYNRSEKNN